MKARSEPSRAAKRCTLAMDRFDHRAAGIAPGTVTRARGPHTDKGWNVSKRTLTQNFPDGERYECERISLVIVRGFGSLPAATCVVGDTGFGRGCCVRATSAIAVCRKLARPRAGNWRRRDSSHRRPNGWCGRWQDGFSQPGSILRFGREARHRPRYKSWRGSRIDTHHRDSNGRHLSSKSGGRPTEWRIHSGQYI
jgi:hypothetical protein